MNDFALLSLFGFYLVGLALIVVFVLYLNRAKPRHPAPGE
jgi:hypothetical protein